MLNTYNEGIGKQCSETELCGPHAFCDPEQRHCFETCYDTAHQVKGYRGLIAK